MNKQFETTLETNEIPTYVKVIDKPYSASCVSYEKFKEFFKSLGLKTQEELEIYLEDNEYCDQDWISEIAEFYDVEWAYCDPDGGRCKGNDYFIIYE